MDPKRACENRPHNERPSVLSGATTGSYRFVLKRDKSHLLILVYELKIRKYVVL